MYTNTYHAWEEIVRRVVIRRCTNPSPDSNVEVGRRHERGGEHGGGECGDDGRGVRVAQLAHFVLLQRGCKSPPPPLVHLALKLRFHYSKRTEMKLGAIQRPFHLAIGARSNN